LEKVTVKFSVGLWVAFAELHPGRKIGATVGYFPTVRTENNTDRRSMRQL